MSWERRLLGDDELRPFIADAAAPLDFRARVRALLAQQQSAWPMLRAAVGDLQAVATKRLLVGDCAVTAQFNPRRIVSTAARVDAATIQQRPCFLCAEQLPPEERGVAFGGEFVALCNPFPVLRDHLVIAARRHTPQAIAGNFGALLDLTQALGAEFLTLYNGPRCGASAPDHLHFQACAKADVPLFAELEAWPQRPIRRAAEIELGTPRDYRINLLAARGRERGVLLDCFDRIVRALADEADSAAEPLFNLLATFAAGRWTVIIIPRSKHRPECYFAEDETKLTISPAAIDLAGVLVVPEAHHFARLTAREAAAVYAEVTFAAARFRRLTLELG